MAISKVWEKIFYHVEILVLVQIVDLKQVLRLEAVILAALEEQLDIFPLLKTEKETKVGIIYFPFWRKNPKLSSTRICYLYTASSASKLSYWRKKNSNRLFQSHHKTCNSAPDDNGGMTPYIQQCNKDGNQSTGCCFHTTGADRPRIGLDH